MPVYVALLRGINVGGKNLIKMPALKACFEDHGFEDVTTYIQSGNVIFRARSSRVKELSIEVEDMLRSTFPYDASIVLRTSAQMRSVVTNAPGGFGADPDRYRYDVLFLKPPLTASRALKQVSTRPDVDEVAAGAGVLYWSRLASKASSSRLSRVASLPIYKEMTVRNWNTTSKLARMLEEIKSRASQPSPTRRS